MSRYHQGLTFNHSEENEWHLLIYNRLAERKKKEQEPFEELIGSYERILETFSYDFQSWLSIRLSESNKKDHLDIEIDDEKKHLQDQISELVRLKNKFDKKYRDLEQENQHKQNIIDQLKSVLTELNVKHRDCNETKNILENRIKQLENKCQELTNENKIVKDKFKLFETKLHSNDSNNQQLIVTKITNNINANVIINQLDVGGDFVDVDSDNTIEALEYQFSVLPNQNNIQQKSQLNIDQLAVRIPKENLKVNRITPNIEKRIKNLYSSSELKSPKNDHSSS